MPGLRDLREDRIPCRSGDFDFGLMLRFKMPVLTVGVSLEYMVFKIPPSDARRTRLTGAGRSRELSRLKLTLMRLPESILPRGDFTFIILIGLWPLARSGE